MQIEIETVEVAEMCNCGIGCFRSGYTGFLGIRGVALISNEELKRWIK